MTARQCKENGYATQRKDHPPDRRHLGSGLALAHRFHAAGNTVIITGGRTALLKRNTADHPGMVGCSLDVSDASAICPLAARVVADPPALNVVFLDTAEATVATNLLGPVRLTAALMPIFWRSRAPRS